jgi:fructosamine-3-kinase
MISNLSGVIQELFGPEMSIKAVRPVAGGDINDAYLVLLDDGRRIFLKENLERNIRFFETEQTGLAAIRDTRTAGRSTICTTC